MIWILVFLSSMSIPGDWLLLCAMAGVSTHMCEVQDAPHEVPCQQNVVWLVPAKDDAHAYMHINAADACLPAV